jgi:hypothetical protein
MQIYQLKVRNQKLFRISLNKVKRKNGLNLNNQKDKLLCP